MGKTKKSYEEALDRYNAGDLEGLAEEYAEDAVLVTPNGTFEGRAAIREFWRWDRASCPDRKTTIEALIERGDTLATEFKSVGTNTGPTHMADGTELPATGKHIEIRGMDFIQMRADGKATVHHMYWDNMEFARQVGLIPGAAAA